MDIQVRKPEQVQSVQNKAHTWELWHRRFSHISYDGLKYLHDAKLVEDFDVDEISPKPDCQACTEAKQSIKLFLVKAEHCSERSRKLTHINVWGKFPVTSIDGYQYFIAFVDDHSWYTTTEGLKNKSEVAQKVKDYIMYLWNKGMIPEAISFNEGGEFLVGELQEWLKKNGILAQLTVLYSPSQNSVVERMNHTLVELAHAMMNACTLRLFLWERTIQHTVYLWNRAYTKALKETTPFQIWTGEKLSIKHLWEFRAPVGILW